MKWRTRTSARYSIAIIAAATAFLLGVNNSPSAMGCPFCSAISNTFSEDFAAMDAVIIARLTKYDAAAQGLSTLEQPQAATSLASFQITEVLKGQKLLPSDNAITTAFFGDARKGDMFLVMGSDPKKLSWLPPKKINDRQHKYLTALVDLPKEGTERLRFFQQYLEDKDQDLANDAYDEFARAPYDAVKQLKPYMDHDQLVKWIQDPEVPSNHRRLYFTMLGICGSDKDLPMLAKRLRATDAQSKSGLDALIACYLTLKGPDGVALIEDLFLKKRDDNFSDNYADVYAAIMALRFHGTENDVVSRQRVLSAFHYLLDNPSMADLIIADLARWEDWSQLDDLVELFKTADTKKSWVREPIVNYVRACPLPAAKTALEELKKTDPEAVKRAMTFFSTLPQEKEK